MRFLDPLTANIRNPNTRAAYAVAGARFFPRSTPKYVAPLAAVRTHYVSAYVQALGRRYRAPTVKQHLAAIRMLFDWLIVGQVFSAPNLAAAVRGGKHSARKARPPCSTATRPKTARQYPRLNDRRAALLRADRPLGLHLRAGVGGAAHER